MGQDHDDAIAALERENAALRRAIALLHRVANLSRESLELRSVCYATLTGVTAGVGLGLNRAMLFLVERGDAESSSASVPRRLHGVAAVGPNDPQEADRVWKSIAAEAPDLRALYEAGQRARAEPAALDRRVRECEVDIDGDSAVALALRRLALVVGEGSDDLGGLFDPHTAIAAPLRGRIEVLGVLYGDNRFSGQPIDEFTAQVFAMIADHTAGALENARRFEDVARAARTDALTGLGHHGALMECLGEAVLEAHRSAAPLSVAMIDLDDFKVINDTFGHPLGDRLLVELATRLRRAARSGSVFRYGGEEFTVLLPGATAEAACAAAERLRTAVGALPVDLGDGVTVTVTCSIGVATMPPLDTGARLIEAADRALLRAKAAGKNRVLAAQ